MDVLLGRKEFSNEKETGKNTTIYFEIFLCVMVDFSLQHGFLQVIKPVDIVQVTGTDNIVVVIG